MAQNEVGYKIVIAEDSLEPPTPVTVAFASEITLETLQKEGRYLVKGTNDHFVNFAAVNVGLSVSSETENSYTGGSVVTPFARTITFKVDNEYTAGTRKETIRASVPFAKAQVQSSDLDNLVVSGHETAWLPLQYWNDGSIKIAQAQFTDTLDGESGEDTKTYALASAVGMALQGSFQAHPNVNIEIGTEVHDTNDVPYLGFISGAGEVIQTTPLVETRFYRYYHEVSAGMTGIQRDGSPRDYLATNVYITKFRDIPISVVDWVIANDYLGSDSPGGSTDPNLYPLGAVDVNNAYFLASGMQQIYAYRANKDNLVWAQTRPTGHIGWRPLTNTYIGDGQTRRYRFILRSWVPDQAERELSQRTSEAMQTDPMFPLASKIAWQDSSAAGLLGGPIDGPADSLSRAQNEYSTFENNSYRFGTWGDRFDAKTSSQTGTPRNQGLTEPLAHAIQGEYPKLLRKLEAMAKIQSARPYHLYNLDVADTDRLLLFNGLPFLSAQGGGIQYNARQQFAVNPATNGPYGAYKTRVGWFENANGWNGYDSDHITVDLLFDYYTITGDPWAKKEMAQLGESFKSMFRINTGAGFATENMQCVRCEGWTMQAWTMIYLVTQDTSIRDYAMRRFEEVVYPQRRDDHAASAIAWQSNYPTVGPFNHEFFMPWQHGAALYGYLGAYNSFEASAGSGTTSSLLHICEAIPGMLEYSWVSSYESPIFGFVAQGLRYYVPTTYNGNPIPASGFEQYTNGAQFGDSPLGGAHTFLTAGLYHLKALTSDSAVAAQADYYADFIRGSTLSDENLWNKWHYQIPQSDVP